METYKEIKKDLLWLCVIILLLHLVGRAAMDDESRSGLTPRTDARTGCQYLESMGGGLEPADGAGYCCLQRARHPDVLGDSGRCLK